METVIIKKRGRPIGSKPKRANYELQFVDIKTGNYETVNKFNTFDDIINFLQSKNIHLQKQTIQSICNNKIVNDFIKVLHI